MRDSGGRIQMSPDISTFCAIVRIFADIGQACCLAKVIYSWVKKNSNTESGWIFYFHGEMMSGLMNSHFSQQIMLPLHLVRPFDRAIQLS